MNFLKQKRKKGPKIMTVSFFTIIITCAFHINIAFFNFYDKHSIILCTTTFIFTAWRYQEESNFLPLFAGYFIFYLIIIIVITIIIIIDIMDHCYLLAILFYCFLSCAYFLFYCRCIITDT